MRKNQSYSLDINSFTENQYVLQQYQQNQIQKEENSTLPLSMKYKEIIRLIIKNDLTERQRYCILGFYVKNKSMTTIAKELKISPSTVSRHIKKGLQHLEKFLKYLYLKEGE